MFETKGSVPNPKKWEEEPNEVAGVSKVGSPDSFCCWLRTGLGVEVELFYDEFGGMVSLRTDVNDVASSSELFHVMS